ncbi:MAG TPA: GntR family transcriptional regulator [bacterium]|nr:GntR family transcriptional regulator [bacterium]
MTARQTAAAADGRVAHTGTRGSAGPTVEGVEKVLRGDSVYRVLKDKVLDYILRPGQRMTEEQVAEDLHVSRTPAREALRRLEQEGWLTLVPHQGYYVRAFTTREVDEIYELRIGVERHTARISAERGAPEALARLDAAWTEMQRAPAAGDALVWLRADEEFHYGVAASTGNRELAGALRRINERIRIIRRIDYTRHERAASTIREHLEILARIRAGDAASAADRMERHILESKASVKALAQMYLMEERDEV